MSGSGHWHPGELVGPGSAYGAAAVAVPVALAVIVSVATSSPELLGGYLVGAVCVAIGVMMGSTATAAVGVGICGLVTATESFNIASTAAVGAALFTTMVLHDLSMTARRGSVQRPVWFGTATATLLVVLCGAAMSVAAWAMASAQTWSYYLIPVGILSIGVAVRFAGRIVEHRLDARRSRQR